MTALYRIYGERSSLIYVGVTDNLPRRMADHCSKEWWRDMRAMSVEEFPTRAAALAAEAELIRTARPTHNVIHNPAPGTAAPTIGDPSTTRWLSVQETASQVGVTPRTVRRWIAAGRLKCYRTGPRLLRIDSEDLAPLFRRLNTASSR